MPINILGLSTPPVVPTPATEKVTMPVIQEAGIAPIADPLIGLLKQLLPVDTPVGMLLEKFRQSTIQSDPQPGEEKPLADIASLLRSLPVDLKTVTGEQLRAVIDRLGLRYEPMLQAALTRRIFVPTSQLTSQNLKAALLQFLARPSSPDPQEASAAAPRPSLQALPQIPGSNNTVPSQLLQALGDHVRENLETLLVRQLQTQLRAAVTQEADQKQLTLKNLPLGSAEAQDSVQDESLARTDLLKILMTADSGSELPSHRTVIESRPPQPQPRVADAAVESADPSVAPQGSSTEGFTQVTGSLGQPRTRASVDQQTTQSASTSSNLPGRDEVQVAAPSQAIQAPGAVRQQAHELLTAIERTQVLNSINSERGEPITFQIPFVLDGQTSTAQFYVERRLDESRAMLPEERHYTVVALLELSGLGQLRIDLALHRKHLSIKVTVEREETELFAAQLLPELGQSLGSQGFAVEFLKCERKGKEAAGSEELQDRTLPTETLINLRA